MNIISWNVNGIRALEKKGALTTLLKTNAPDILFLQEIKATPDQLSEELTAHPEYHQWYHPAEKKGYAGTGVWMKKGLFQKATVHTGMPDFDDTEGRISQLHAGDFLFLGVYFPNGGKSERAWTEKISFYKQFLETVNAFRKEGKKVIFMGDINCCHHPIDIARPKENEGKIGFHPDERACLDEWIAAGWIDVWREKNPNLGGQYSWWSYRAGARARNVGWRLDYFFVDVALLGRVEKIEYLDDIWGSDHCPVSLQIRRQ